MRSPRAAVWLLAVFVFGGTLAAFAARNDLIETDTGAAQADADAVHRGARSAFAIAVDGQRTLFVDAVSGRTWLLTESARPHGSPVWLPVRRIESEQEARVWREEQHPELLLTPEERQVRQQIRFEETQLEIYEKRFSPEDERVRKKRETLRRLREKQSAE